MGLLDDAIREHLDLKRRRGADPSEIERAEREALGPVRRGPEQPEQVEPDLDDALTYDHEVEQEWDESFEDNGGEELPFRVARDSEPFAAEPEPFALDEPPLTEERPSHSPPPPRDDFEDFDDPEWTEQSPAEPYREPPPTPRNAPVEQPGDETVEYDVEGGLEEEDRDQDADDMLEETPDFLQDTPDHDRLWFEQRPPRDFDIDG